MEGGMCMWEGGEGGMCMGEGGEGEGVEGEMCMWEGGRERVGREGCVCGREGGHF